MDPITIAGTAIAGVNTIRGLFNKRRLPNYRPIIDRYYGMTPSGWLSPEDKAMAARTRSRGNEAAAEGYRYNMGRLGTTLMRRGLTGSVAGAALKKDVGRQQAIERQKSYEKSADQEYGMYDKNRSYRAGVLAAGLGAELGGERTRYAADEARNATLWNSVLEMAPWLQDAWSAAGTKNAADVAAMAPSTVTGPPTGYIPGVDPGGKFGPRPGMR